jgi:hypothetical protein
VHQQSRAWCVASELASKKCHTRLAGVQLEDDARHHGPAAVVDARDLSGQRVISCKLF